MINVRHPRPDEEAAWRPLWRGYLDFYESDVPEAVTALTWKRFFDSMEPMRCFCAYDGAAMIGFTAYVLHRSTWAARHYCYLEDLFVSPGGRGCGAGRALIEAVRDAAAQQECERLFWATREGNKTAQALYDKLAVKTDFLQYRMPLK